MENCFVHCCDHFYSSYGQSMAIIDLCPPATQQLEANILKGSFPRVESRLKAKVLFGEIH